jgi:hypothetical protein
MADGRLSVVFSYSEAIHDRRTIAALGDRYMDALRGLVDAARSAPAASDGSDLFPAARISDRDLRTVLAQMGDAGAEP